MKRQTTKPRRVRIVHSEPPTLTQRAEALGYQLVQTLGPVIKKTPSETIHETRFGLEHKVERHWIDFAKGYDQNEQTTEPVYGTQDQVEAWIAEEERTVAENASRRAE